MTMALNDFLKNALIENNQVLSDVQQTRILQYLDLLTRWNRITNLTRITTPSDMVMLHIIDSLSINPFLQGMTLLDVGSGAGAPGIPLAIIHPEKKFTLLDSQQKKVLFLRQVILELKLNHVEVIHARVEDFKPVDCFDMILTRAFASLKLMLLACTHLLNTHGQFLAMKGLYPHKELQEIPPGFQVQAVHPLLIKGLHAERHLVCIKKDTSWEK